VFACLVVCRWQVRNGVQRRGSWQEYETWCKGLGMVAQVGYSVAVRSRGRVASCAVFPLHVETRSAGFLVEPENQGRRFVSGLASKPLGRFLAVWPQNLLGRFLPVWPQNWWRWFFLFWPQNRWWVSWLSLKTKVVEGFPVWASKPAALVW
jgi:hypothetical protein